MKSVVIHALLAFLGLFAAYAVHGAKETEDPSDAGVEVYSCARRALASVSFTGPSVSVTLALKEQDDPKRASYWFSEQRQGGHEKASQSFMGSSKATAEYLTSLAPLRARRALGALPVATLEELGLADPASSKKKPDAKGKTAATAAASGSAPKGTPGAGAAAPGNPDAAGPMGEPDTATGGETPAGVKPSILTVNCQGEAHRFRVGSQVFGSDDRYLQDEATRVVYLIRGDVVDNLASASSRLMQRRLIDLVPKDVAALDVKVGPQQRTLLHHNRLDPQRAEWVEAKTPETRNEQFGNFVGRFGQLTVLEYLAMGIAPGAEPGKKGGAAEVATAPVPVLSMRFKGAAGEGLGEVELVRIDGQLSGGRTYYARGPATRAWVTVVPTVAQQLEDDARAMVGLEPLPRPPPVRGDDTARGLPHAEGSAGHSH